MGKKKEIAAGSGGGFKRSAFQEVDLGQEEVVISTAFGGTTVIEKRKRCEIEAEQLRGKAIEGKGIAQIDELERIELENRRMGDYRRHSDARVSDLRRDSDARSDSRRDYERSSSRSSRDSGDNHRRNSRDDLSPNRDSRDNRRGSDSDRHRDN